MFIINIFFLLFIIFIIYLWNNNKEKEEEQEIKNNEYTEEIIKDYVNPKIDSYGETVDELYDFFFSIQDFYRYNPQAYEETIDNINSFFKLYDYAKRDSGKCGFYYKIAESKKTNALNSIHSLIFNIPPEDIFDDKITRAHLRLDTILTQYLSNFYDLCREDFYKNGFNVYTQNLNTGPKEYNNYNDEIFSYQFY